MFGVWIDGRVVEGGGHEKLLKDLPKMAEKP
jgi:hypothetical protein